MSKPMCVCISDIHFTVQNLELCTQALSAAILKANNLKIPLVIAGDLNDTKAIIRAEVANRIIVLLKEALTPVYILVGNHDLVNEKGLEHGLNYLSPYATIVEHPTKAYFGTRVFLIPYHNNPAELLNFTKALPKGSILIMHQGFMGAAMGDYVQDKTSIDPELMKDFTVISGHYHRHQTIGTVTYIGSTFTMTFGEANDGPKGFLVLNEDGTFQREILHLRKHVILNHTVESLALHNLENFDPNDLIWLKVAGTKSELAKIDKKKYLGIKLDLITTDYPSLEDIQENVLPQALLDLLIESLEEQEEYKKLLKQLWRNILETK